MIEELLGSEPGFDETRAAIRETVEKIRSETIAERLERAARYTKYVEAEGLLDALEGGDTVLISARWLLKQERGYVLPKRGELPLEAIISADELRRSYEGEGFVWADASFPIIAVSHCWRTKAHPDPEGVTTRMLQEQLETDWDHFAVRREFSDVGIFLDWCSLWQSPRTPEQQECFDRALPAINLWYGNSKTYAWLVTDARVPHADGRLLGYADKGWTIFESTLISMIKTNSGLQIKELGDGYGLGVAWYTPKPPAEPLMFCAGHRYGKQVYTNGSDRDRIVAPKFKEATEDILGGVQMLSYDRQAWDDVHAARLGLVLPLCLSLRVLRLCQVGLTSKGLHAILEFIVNDRAVPRLERLDISGNRAVGDEGAFAVGAALKKQGALENLRELRVDWCDLTATGLRAIIEPIVSYSAVPNLKELNIANNRELGNEGVRALVAALERDRQRCAVIAREVRFEVPL